MEEGARLTVYGDPGACIVQSGNGGQRELLHQRLVNARHGLLVRKEMREADVEGSGGREEFGGDQPNRGRWSISNPGDTGEVIQAAMRHGAKTDFMDEAWWLPSPRTGRFGRLAAQRCAKVFR